MRPSAVALPLVLASLVCLSAAAQSQPHDVYVSVLDGKGVPVTDLAAADFSVREDGVAREVLKVAPATEPMQVAVLIDDSQAATDDIHMIRDGLTRFVDALRGKAEIALITFGERPTLVVDYTTDPVKLKQGIGRVFARSGAGAYFLEAVVEASQGFEKREAKRPVMVAVMTEGLEFSTLYYQRVLDELYKSRAALHVLTITGVTAAQTDEVRNRNIVVAEGTERTGGRRDQILAASAIPDRMQQLADELLHQYVVTYARPETLIPPEKIEVTVKRPGVTARARTRLTGKS
jgi:Ca-activated chloride channel family protein